MASYYDSGRGSFLSAIPVVTKNLLIINLLLWVATFVMSGKGIDLNRYLALHFWQGSDFNLAQMVTYMFMHDTSSVQSGFLHIFCNMFNLWCLVWCLSALLVLVAICSTTWCVVWGRLWCKSLCGNSHG